VRMGEADEEQPHSMSPAAPAQARAPLLMISSSPTCHISLACVIITPSSHFASIFFFSFFKQSLSDAAFNAFYFFYLMGC